MPLQALVVAGGAFFGSTYWTSHNTVETLLLGAAAWTFLASLPYKIMNAHASIVAGRLRLTGGHNLATMGGLSEV